MNEERARLLLRLLDWLRLKGFTYKGTDVASAILGGLVGAVIGLLFVVVWQR